MRKIIGFTLLEMLLVLVIMSSIILMFLNFTTQKATETQRDLTVMQVDQVLNAGMSYYIGNGAWPITCGTSGDTALSSTSPLSTLQPHYIPSALNNNPYGHGYVLTCSLPNAGGVFYVFTQVDTAINALIIAGRLPLSYITTLSDATSATPPTQASGCSTVPPAATCTVVVSSVNVPGQNINNARSTNFAGVYHNGGCVPVPNCPSNMTPEIFVSVAQIMGTNDATSTGSSPNVYPITNFTAYATGGTGSGTTPLDCSGSGNPACSGTVSNTDYWRACVSVGTEDGAVTSGSGTTSWGQWQTLVAFTRCAPTNEPAGSPTSAWTP
jgi:type II secretory pathway pseudopilin PulG